MALVSEGIGMKEADAVSKAEGRGLKNMLNNTGRVVNEYNKVARKTWDAIEKLAKIKVDIPKYESCSQTIEELRRKAEGG